MRVLVTGGAGFIGSHFVRSLLTDRYAGFEGVGVVVLDKLTYAGNRQNLASFLGDSRLTFVVGDIADANVVDSVMGGLDAVVHFAAESHVDRSIAAATEFITTNVLGTQVLLTAALRHKVPRFVHISTDEVYGSIETGSWPETHPLEPNSPYAASKASSDLLVLAFSRTHGLDASITRCSNNYGPFQHPEKVIPLFVTNLVEGLSVPLYGDGMNVREWLHVDDHCRAVALVLQHGRPGEVYNVGSGAELSNTQLTARLLELMDADWASVEQVTDRKGHDRRYSVDTSKIERELGFHPEVSFDEGLEATVAWYRNNRAWWGPLKSSRSGSQG